jgi:DNA-directed RNA polymerase subunit L
MAIRISVVENEKDPKTAELVMENVPETLVFPLLDKLLEDVEIADARYFAAHPELDKPKIVVRVSKGNPKAAVKRAAKALAADYRELEQLYKKSKG